MVRRKDPFWKYVEDLENGRFSCNFCKRDFAGGISRIKSHLSGLKGRDIQICPQVHEAIKLEAQQAIEAIDTPTKRAKYVAVSNTVLQRENISGSSSSHMPNLCKGQDKGILDKKLVRFIRSVGLSLDAIESPLFKDFVNGVAEHGPGYQVPRSYNIAFQLLVDIEKEVKEYVDNVIKYSVKTGCTLMYNKSPWKISFVNIFAYTPIGVAYMGHSKNIFDRVGCFDNTMELIGPRNVVQLIINDGEGDLWAGIRSICGAANEYPWIYWTPCATRGIELLLRKIYDVPFVYNTIQVARGIGTYLYKNKVNVPYLRKKVNGSFRRVQRKGDVIAFNFFMLTSLLEVENELQALQEPIETVSSNWGKRLTKTQLKKFLKGARFTDYVIRCKEFWSRAKMVAQVMRPMFQALCLVRCEGPTSGYLYEMMESVKDALEQCRDSNHVLYDVIRTILDEVRSDIIHPIHAAAAFLNPMYMCSEKYKEDVEMTRGMNYILEHLVAVEEKEDFVKQAQLYSMKDSNVLTAEAMIMLKTSHPRIWWEFCGNHISVLQKYAIRILSQPCSSSFCNQYELLHEDLTDHGFIFNTMMMERYKSLQTQMIEPIILDKLEVSDDVNYQHLFENESDNEWDNESDEEDYEYYEYSFSNDYEYLVDWSHRYADDMIKDPTGSWLDGWPRK